MNVLLLGANGQLGRTFLQCGELACLGDLIIASRDGTFTDGGTCESADLSAPDELLVLLERARPGIIINAAAYTSVDRAEQEETASFRVNADAVSLLGQWAASHQALVISYSSDYVFDGKATAPYAVDAAPAPLNAYGRSKLAGEQALSASGAAHLLFRTSWVYAAHGHNFLRTMLRLGAEREQLAVVADQYGAPTSTNLIAKATLAAVQQWLSDPPSTRRRLEGTHHLVASGVTTWHDFALAIFELAHEFGILPQKPAVKAVTTDDFPTLARRPAYSALDNSEFQELFGIVLPHWTVGLAEVMRELAFHGKIKQC